MPNNIVMMQPPGSLPGMRSFAMAPMMSPTTNIQMIPCAPKSMLSLSRAVRAAVNVENIGR